MKLLSKIEINTLKSVERKKEIDEGVKLAKKVDTLREVASKEESNLRKFRIETLAIIQSEINLKIKERDSLLEEIKKLKNICQQKDSQ